MNRQRKVVITITYNEMGIIIDTKAEEVAQTEKRTEERTETHSCDLISRQDAIEVAKQHWYKADIAGALAELPSAQPERPSGKWIRHKDGSATCDQCGFRQVAVWDFDGWQNFCGHCGADLRGDTDLWQI